MIFRCQPRSAPSRRCQRQRGYSLIELLVGLTVSLVVLMVLFSAFQAKTKLARTQIDIADMQQAQRAGQNEMVRLIRMTGRGGLADMVNNNGVRLLPALNVRDNVAANENIAIGDGSSPIVEQGTDVLTIRGVFNTPVYQLNFADPTTWTLYDSSGNVTTNAAQAERARLVITDPSPTGIPQDLTALADAVNQNREEAIVVVSPIDETAYAVFELDTGNNTNVGANQATLSLLVSGGTYTNDYRNLYPSGTGGTPALPSGLTNAAYAGILEEYRFYVREPDPNTTPAPSLAVAQMFPGTEVGHPVGGTGLDIADNIVDLQIALGFDSSLGAALADRNGDGLTNEDDIEITEAANGQDDDWLFNSTQDDPNQAPWIPPWDSDPLTGTPPQPQVYYVRLTTLARVQVPERNYDSLQIQRIENRDVTPFNTQQERLFRRRLLRTTIDLRNL